MLQVFSSRPVIGGAKSTNDLVSLWQSDTKLMKCQDCGRNNLTKATSQLTFYTFRCEHFNFVCSDCAKGSKCKSASANKSAVCLAPLLFQQQQQQQQQQGRAFPQRPWLRAEAMLLNNNREEVLSHWNQPRSDFKSDMEYEDYATERAALAHDLHDDDDKVVNQTIQKMRSTPASIADVTKVRRNKMFNAKLADTETHYRTTRQAYERDLEVERDKQFQWLKRQRKDRTNKRLDYLVFANTESALAQRAGIKHLRKHGHGQGESSNKEYSKASAPAQHSRNAASELPEKPKRKYKFAGSGPTPEHTYPPPDFFRSSGFNRKWEYDRFMADVEGSWE